MEKRINLKRCAAALVGILFVGIGVAFNAQAKLGNDPVGIFYDGIRNAMGLSDVQLGLASNIVNIALVVLLLIIARKHISVGTLIYIIPYGFCVDVGTKLYQLFFAQGDMPLRVLAVVLGCLSIFWGVAIFIVADIGVDPMTGLSLFMAESLKWEYFKAKILFDVTMTVIGFLLGGKLGVITLITSVIGGPGIQFFTNLLKKIVGTISARRG